jgi:hypothetical protein
MKPDPKCKECKGTGEVANTGSRGPEWFDCDCTMSESFKQALAKIPNRTHLF